VRETPTHIYSTCAQRDESPLLAALGILSHEARTEFRQAIRSSWLRAPAAPSIARRFVLRYRAASMRVQREAAAQGDVVFVDAEESLSRARGPLVSLSLWWRCALYAWPNAAVIGKADDDTWINLPGVEAHLSASLAAVQEQYASAEPASVYWGIFETFHWETNIHRPTEWGALACTGRRSVLNAPMPRPTDWGDGSHAPQRERGHGRARSLD